MKRGLLKRVVMMIYRVMRTWIHHNNKAPSRVTRRKSGTGSMHPLNREDKLDRMLPNGDDVHILIGGGDGEIDGAI